MGASGKTTSSNALNALLPCRLPAVARIAWRFVGSGTVSVAIGLTLAAGSAAQADEPPISTDRGTAFSNSSSVIPLGRLQVEGGFTFNSDHSETFGELAIRYPVLPRLEVRLTALSLGHVPGSSGLFDPSVGVKQRLVDGSRGRPEVSVIAQTTLPVGSEPFRVRRSQPTLRLPWFLQLDSTTGVGGMLSISDLGPTGARFTQYGAGAYLSRAFDTKATGYLEVYDVAPIAYGGPSGGFVDGCVTYLLSQNLQVDLRCGTGFNQSRDGWSLGGGMGYRFRTR